MKKAIKDLKKYWGYSLVAAGAQLRTEVVNSYLTWIWWILNPICFMLIYTLVFGYVFNANEPYFSIFVFIGVVIWDFFSRMLNSSVKLVKRNKSIVSKVYLPKYILILVNVWVNGFKMMIAFGVVFVMLIFYQVPLSWSVLYFIPILLILVLFTFGCCTFLLHYGVFIEDLSNVLSIVLRLLFYITGIFYHVATKLPEPYGEILTKCNPVALLLESMRNALLYGKPQYNLLLFIWFVISIVLAFAGIRKIYKNENNYIKVI